MDCSLGQVTKEQKRDKLSMMANVAGQVVQTFLDTGCNHTLIKAWVISPEGGVKVPPIKKVCLHGQTSVYPRQRIRVTLQAVTRGIPVGIATDLPYQMVQGWDWPKIYKILEKNQDRDSLYEGLAAKEIMEELMEDEGTLWDLEVIACETQLRGTRGGAHILAHLGDRDCQMGPASGSARTLRPAAPL